MHCNRTEHYPMPVEYPDYYTDDSEEDGEEDCVEVVVGLKGKINFLFC